jgi:hypothetical protein
MVRKKCQVHTILFRLSEHHSRIFLTAINIVLSGSPVTFVVAEEGTPIKETKNHDVTDTSMSRTNGVDHSEISLTGPALEGCRVGKETYFLINSSIPAPGYFHLCIKNNKTEHSTSLFHRKP